MAEKIETNPSLKVMNEALKNTKCLKSLLESSDNSLELVFPQKFAEHFENLNKNLELYQHKECLDGDNYSTRKEILNNLSLLWDIFCTVESQKQNCPSFLNLITTLRSKESYVFEVLFKCLKCNDHFIVFQGSKVLCKVFKLVPSLMLHSKFDDLVDLSVSVESKECGLWLPIYIAKILMEMFLQMDLNENGLISNKNKSTTEHCSHVCQEEHNDAVSPNEITSSLCCYWLKLTSHNLTRLLNVFKSECLLEKDLCWSRVDSFQQVLTTMLSYGKIFITSFNFCLQYLNNPTCEEFSQETFKNECSPINDEDMDLQVNDTLKHGKHPRIYPSGNWCGPRLDNGNNICKNEYKDAATNDKDFNAKDCKAELLKQILAQLIEINHKKCLLHFSRTVFQFLNNVVSAASEHYLGQEVKGSMQKQSLLYTRTCSFLVKNCCSVLGNVPHVSGRVHFGGVDNKVQLETSCSLPYDEVSLRKVLLLVVKLIVVSLHSPHDLPWHGPLESWSSFIIKLSHSKSLSTAVWLIRLFSEQDDELVYMLFCLLHLYQELFSSESLQQIPSWANQLEDFLNPHEFFVEFLESINYDHSLLLDFLISNETSFLPYFHKYLRYLANDWEGFKGCLEQRQALSNKELPGVTEIYKGDVSLCFNTEQFSESRKSLSDVGCDGNDSCDDNSNNDLLMILVIILAVLIITMVVILVVMVALMMMVVILVMMIVI
ncbi:uncharacterized protein LOC114541157 [Dendronephthya gigantea]|uniref:uncharacterized protein LOC114541157 n=1 Tax=Dendronephthya gigantea TaxID=151771 RepID=UPI00106990F2|nr:uncharacterized protein LOC114541157 [Dendronephthya gigantea]